jgi:hypothetical protein
VAHSTTEPFTKFVPVTVRVKPERLHEGVEPGDKDEIVGGTMVNGREEGQVMAPDGTHGIILNALI